MAVAAVARRPLDVDSFMDHLRKIGFTRVWMQIDAARPLTPEVFIRGRESKFWQPLVYENLPVVCFKYGCIGHEEGVCPTARSIAGSGTAHLLAKNIVMEGLASWPEGPLPASIEDRSSEEGGRPRVGPWLVTSHVQMSLPTRPQVKTRKEPNPEPKSASAPPCSSSPSSKERRPTSSSPPSSPPNTEGWQKPSKAARRRSPEPSSGTSSAVVMEGSRFSALSTPMERMDLEGVVIPLPLDAFMSDVMALSLKRSRSPGKGKLERPLPEHHLLLMASSSASLVDKVCRTLPCMDTTPTPLLPLLSEAGGLETMKQAQGEESSPMVMFSAVTKNLPKASSSGEKGRG